MSLSVNSHSGQLHNIVILMTPLWILSPGLGAPAFRDDFFLVFAFSSVSAVVLAKASLS